MQKSQLRRLDLKQLILKVHSERHHVSTDNTRELRLELEPRQLQLLNHIATQGLTGTRPPRAANPYANDEALGGDEQGGSSKAAPRARSPRIWTPAALLVAALPELVLGYNRSKTLKARTPVAGHVATRGIKNIEKTPEHHTGTHSRNPKLQRKAPYEKPVAKGFKSGASRASASNAVLVISSSDDDKPDCRASREVIDLT